MKELTRQGEEGECVCVCVCGGGSKQKGSPAAQAVQQALVRTRGAGSQGRGSQV